MTATTDSWWRTDAIAWRAKGWELEVRGDEIAEIRHGGRMLLRAVRAAVRDRGWQTVPVAVLSTTADAETLTLRLRHEGLGARIDSTLRVTVADALRIEWDAVSAGDFDTCRVGLVALHPAAHAGRDAVVRHPDGSSERIAFPVGISPHQPISDIRALEVARDVTLEFSGDVFEMEDQRNWTDASFKTYSRPLALPYPYRLSAGEQIRQTIAIRIEGTADQPPARPEQARIALTASGSFPAIGCEASTAPDPVATCGLGSFRAVELNLATPNWQAALTRAVLDGRPLDVRIVTDGDPAGLVAVTRALRGLDVLRVAPFDAMLHVSDEPVVSALRTALHGAGLSLPVLSGARSHFTELNREQDRIARDVAGIAVNTTPLFHTLDTEQLVEAVPIQRLIAEQTVRIADGMPVHIGPVSLRPRFNNVATTPEPAPSRPDLSEGYGAEFTGAADDRQRAPELGAWLIASAAALAVPGVASLSWFETRGPRGVAGTPAAAALEALLELEGRTLLSGESPDGLLWAIGAETPECVVALAANLGRQARQFSVALPSGDTHHVDVEGGHWVRIA